ncbi:Uu.00g064920.m01.CDS01 [Anthostomella pinea]|uniref:Uu.00g064920.m01.CDS01 n=1 Tax=Anthostomella pinea TaxID=933095 RepID=A0AAI8VTM0_9PEZI|nr:Uu.00g064920.m01.CDS01 [Anthostomella pinea]
MCRLMVFSGTCTKCGGAQTWDDLTQELSCLEAKNAGAFGECDGGISVEEHSFDQECDTCADEDEGFGDDVEGGSSRGGDKKRQRTS